MNKYLNRMFSVTLILALMMSLLSLASPVLADNTAQTLPFNQDWTNTGLITTSDSWPGVSGIIGYRGDGLASTGTDPQTVLADGSATPVDVNANQTNPNTFTTGGVAEFEIANPVIALQGSGTADAPHIVIYLNTTGETGINISYNVRDIDGAADNATQQVALQYRVGNSGNFTNVPAGYIADATTGPSLATLVTPVNVTLPADVDNQPDVQIRIITADASGSDEWVGIDDIVISTDGGPTPGQPLPLAENFDDCTLAGWEIVSVDADTAHTWTCSASFSNIEANGFGDTAPADDWLITPPLNLNAQDGDTLTFRSHTSFTDINYPQLHVLYSTDYDGGGDPTSATWTELSGLTLSPENSSLFVDSGDIDLSGISGTNVYVAFQYVSSGTGSGTTTRWRLDVISFFETVASSGWVINEINADPDAANGDANGDGVVNTTQDEFVEVVNNTGGDVNIGGWTLSDAIGVRHTFPSGTVVPASCSVVVFAGGTPTGAFGNSVIQLATSGQLGLNNGGDNVTLFDGVGNVATYTYGGEGGDNQSLTRDPDVIGVDPLVKHSTATGSAGALFSPGTMIDGSPFIGCPGEKKIHEVQGSGPASPLAGNTVIVEGIVVGDFQDGASGANGDLNGFFLQEEDTDTDIDPMTSEGIFVFDGNSPAVNVANGDLVRVQGQVSEFNDLTEITSFSGVTVISSGNPLPAASSLALPVIAVSDFEAFESMRVTFPQTLYISEYFNFDQFGEMVLTSSRQFQPTAVFEPGSTDAANLAVANSLGRITLDDGRTASFPAPAIHPNGTVFDLDNLFRGGDTVQNVTGVIHYAFGLYRIQPTEGADYVSANPRTTEPDDVGGNLKVASFNVLNYFNGNGLGGGFPTSRGATDLAEFNRQRDKIIAAMVTIDADVFGVMEIENDGYGSASAIQDLVNGLNDATAPGTYAIIDPGVPIIGTDEIAVGLIYKTATVTPQGGSSILDTSVDPRFLDNKNRPALAQTFMDNSTGGIFTVAVNHLKSKGSDCSDVGDPDLGDGAGNCNLTRKAAAEALVDWLASDPTGSGDEDFLIIGDLNSYDKEDPIDALVAGGYTDLIHHFLGENAYSYVFDGQLGYLDHALANAGLMDEVTGVTVWHINADEADIIDYDTTSKKPAQDALYEDNAYRSSDHDPVIVGLCLPPTGTTSATPSILSPANHKYVDVSVEILTSSNTDSVTLVSVTSNEPDDGDDDGNTVDDIVIVDDFNFQLRAERSGVGTGRIYTITYLLTNTCGATTTVTTTVTVPLSHGN